MEYGPEIKRGSDAWPETDVRPVWLGTDEGLSLSLKGLSRWWDNARIGKCGDIMWEQATAVRLPAGHWVYKAIEAGFTPCNGKPDDWDGGDVLLSSEPRLDRPMKVWKATPSTHSFQWDNRERPDSHIIGYHRKSTKQTVTIEKRTEDEWLDWTAARGAQRHSRGSIRFMELVRDLGLVTPPTPLERFMAEHPDADRRTAELVLGWKG